MLQLRQKNKVEFEKILEGNIFKEVGTVGGDKFIIKGKNDMKIVNLGVNDLLGAYKETLGDY